MFTYETADAREVRRVRIAQFNGRVATVRSNQGSVTGFVRSIREQSSGNAPRWIITIVPKSTESTMKPLRPASRMPVPTDNLS